MWRCSRWCVSAGAVAAGGQRWTTDVLAPRRWRGSRYRSASLLSWSWSLRSPSAARRARRSPRRAVPRAATVAAGPCRSLPAWRWRVSRSPAVMTSGEAVVRAIGLLAIGTVLVLPVFVGLRRRAAARWPASADVHRRPTSPQNSRCHPGDHRGGWRCSSSSGRGVVRLGATPQYVWRRGSTSSRTSRWAGSGRLDRHRGVIRRIEAFSAAPRRRVYDLVELCADDAEVLWCGGAIVAGAPRGRCQPTSASASTVS